MSISFRILKILSSVSKKISLKSEPINLINILILIMYFNIRIHEDQYLLFGLIGHRNMTSAFERLSWNFNAVPVIFLATSRTGYFVTKISLTQSIHFCSTFLKKLLPSSNKETVHQRQKRCACVFFHFHFKHQQIRNNGFIDLI